MKGNLLNYKEKDFFLNIKQQRRDYFYIYFYFYEALRPFFDENFLYNSPSTFLEYGGRNEWTGLPIYIPRKKWKKKKSKIDK